MKLSAIFILSLIHFMSFNTDAYAQQNCEWRQEGPLGPAWYQPGGWSSCDNSAAQPVAPTIRWATRWGAMAVNPEKPSLGAEVGYDSRRAAERAALARCGEGCKIEITYHDQCGALASSPKTYAAASASTIDEASELAMKNCSKGGVADCKVVYSECSLPERIQ
jgi:hypothetical protein